MNHVWKLGKRGCIALAKDFNHFLHNKCGDSSDIKKCAAIYATEAVERWKNFEQLKPASARENAQQLVHLYVDKMTKIHAARPQRSGVAEMAILLCLQGSILLVRHRDYWTPKLQKKNAGMLTRGKKEYHWDELPAGSNNKRKAKAKPGSLNERILFAGDR